MKKLPKIYKNNINKPLNNNNKVYYSGKKTIEKEMSIDELFKQNEIYRRTTTIILNNGNEITRTIIGRSIKHLITLDNELIPIDDIKAIVQK